jgi:fatty-acyl-CoA synthase
VLNPGASVTAADLMDFCRGRLAGFKIPRHVLFVQDYPMTSSGKVQKFRLREVALEALQLQDT